MTIFARSNMMASYWMGFFKSLRQREEGIACVIDAYRGGPGSGEDLIRCDTEGKYVAWMGCVRLG